MTFLLCRTATARGKAEQADIAAVHAREDALLAFGVSKEFGGSTAAEAAAVAEPSVSSKTNLLNVKNHNAASAPPPASSSSKFKSQQFCCHSSTILISDRPRTPEVVIHAPKEKPVNKALPVQQPKAPPAPVNPPAPQPAAPVQQSRPAQAQPTQPPSPMRPLPSAMATPSKPAFTNPFVQSQQQATPSTLPAAASSNNVMQQRSSVSLIPAQRSMQPPSFMQGGNNNGGMMTTPLTNCDISNTTESAHASMFQIPNHKPQQNSLMAAGLSRQEAASAASGYNNFQRIMEDHFEHYKRPASREQSVDKTHLPPASVLPEARPPRGRSSTRPQINSTPSNVAPAAPSSRAPSRNRTPLPLGTSHTDMDLDLRRKELEAKFAQNGDADQPQSSADPALRFRGQPSQEIAHLGTIPKRTESLYLKQSLDPKGKVSLHLAFTQQPLMTASITGDSGRNAPAKEESSRRSVPGCHHQGSRL